MPRRSELPESIRALAGLQGMEYSDAHVKQDFASISERIHSVIDEPVRTEEAPVALADADHSEGTRRTAAPAARRRAWILVAAAAAAAAGLIAVGLLLSRPEESSRVATRQATPSIQLAAPPIASEKPCSHPPLLAADARAGPVGVLTRVGARGCAVAELETAYGSAFNVRPRHQLWILVQIGGLYPQPGPLVVGADGSWETDVRFGAAGTFAVRLVTAGIGGQRHFRAWLERGKRTGRYPAIPPEDLASDVVALSTISGLRRR